MKIDKLATALLTALLLQFSLQSFGQSVCYYNDTIFDLNGNTIEFKKTYVRKKLFMRTTMIVKNNSDKFMLIDPDDVFLTSQEIKEEKSLYRKTYVIPPHDSKKFHIKFSSKDFYSPFATFSVKRISYSDKVILAYRATKMPLKEGGSLEIEGLRIDILEVYQNPKELHVKTRMFYSDTNLLAINYNNIGAEAGGPPESCFNLKKITGKAHFNPNAKEELYTFVFLRDCANFWDKNKKLIFKNVFSEYSVKSGEGFKATLRRLPEGQEPRDDGKPDDIENID